MNAQVNENLQEDMQEIAKQKTHEFSEKIASFSDKAIDKANEAKEAVQTQTSNLEKMLEDYIQHQPVKSLLFAGVAGAVIAACIRGIK